MLCCNALPQEPLMNASQEAAASDAAANPFAALFQQPAAGAGSGGGGAAAPAGAAAAAAAGAGGAPNEAPLPNPWAASVPPAAGGAGAAGAGANPLLGGLGGLGSLGGMGGGGMPGMGALMNDPAAQQAMQQMMQASAGFCAVLCSGVTETEGERRGEVLAGRGEGSCCGPAQLQQPAAAAKAAWVSLQQRGGSPSAASTTLLCPALTPRRAVRCPRRLPARCRCPLQDPQVQAAAQAMMQDMLSRPEGAQQMLAMMESDPGMRRWVSP